MRVNILLVSPNAKRRNYATVKNNKKNTTGRVELKKFCPGAEPTRFTRNPVVNFHKRRAVALIHRAAVSKTVPARFESLLPCHFHFCRKRIMTKKPTTASRRRKIRRHRCQGERSEPS